MSNSNQNGLLFSVFFFNFIFFIFLFCCCFELMECIMHTAHCKQRTHTSHTFSAPHIHASITKYWQNRAKLVFSLGRFVTDWYAIHENNSQKCEVSAFFRLFEAFCSPSWICRFPFIWILNWKEFGPKTQRTNSNGIDAKNSYSVHGTMEYVINTVINN